MDKKLISEITRIGEIMGVKGSSLINESIACPFCDAIMKQVSNLSALASKNSESIEFKYKVNELLERVKNSEDLNINQKAALQNVITKLKEVESVSDDVSSFKLKVQDVINKNEALKSVMKTKSDLINYKVMSVIDYSKIYNDPKLINDYFENVPKMKEIVVNLDKAFRNPNFKTNMSSKFKSLDDYTDAVGVMLSKTFKDNFIDPTLSAGLVNKFKKYVKEKFELEPDLNPFINKIDNVGDIDNVGKTVVEPEVKMGGGTIESVVANWEKRKPGKGLARFSGVLIDVLAPISNLLRTVLGTLPSSIYLKQVERGINELVTRFEKDLSTAKIDPKNMGGFKNQVRRILIDMQVAKTSDQTFEKLWIEMEKMIRDKSKQLGFDNVDEFITLVKQGGTEGGAGTIENFLKITSDYANGITLWPWVNKTKLYKDFNFDKLGEYLPIMKKWREFMVSFDEKVIKSSEGNKGIGGIIKSFTNISSFLWEWFQGWLLYQAPKRLSVINNMLRNSGITGGRAIASIVGAYLGMVFISYFYEPFIDATIELKERVKAQFGVETDETRTYPQLIADQYKNKFNDLLRGKIDWNPFGVGVIPAVIVSLLDNPKEVADNQQAKLKKEIDDAQSKVNSEMDKRALNTYNEMSDQEKQLAQNHYNTLKQMLSDSYNTYGLTKDQGKFIISRLEFTPTPSLDITNPINSGFDDMKKITDIKSLEELSSKYQDAKSVYEELPKVDKTDIVGNTFLKGKTNKYLVIKINEENQGEFPLGGKPIGYSYWIKPPYGKLSSGVKTTHYFKEFIEQYNNL